ncbi:hypothetical protein Tco_0771513 [Tanacetum coccineum]|uniref:Uncharacterized protein n=1 Tax=Tanacetum coccineum TaxID=301880 RepID=A0ABQ4ZGB1_9ASTR
MGLISASLASVSFPDLLLSSCTVESVLMHYVPTKSAFDALPHGLLQHFPDFVGVVISEVVNLDSSVFNNLIYVEEHFSELPSSFSEQVLCMTTKSTFNESTFNAGIGFE